MCMDYGIFHIAESGSICFSRYSKSVQRYSVHTYVPPLAQFVQYNSYSTYKYMIHVRSNGCRIKISVELSD